MPASPAWRRCCTGSARRRGPARAGGACLRRRRRELRERARRSRSAAPAQVAAARFAGFDYVALGHLHRPQALLGGRLRYSGSPLAYSSSEAGQAKSVHAGGAGGGRRADGSRRSPLPPRRPLRLSAAASPRCARPRPPAATTSSCITLTDPRPVPEAQRRLAEVFPRIIGFGYAGQERSAGPLSGPGVRARAHPADRPLRRVPRRHARHAAAAGGAAGAGRGHRRRRSRRGLSPCAR